MTGLANLRRTDDHGFVDLCRDMASIMGKVLCAGLPCLNGLVPGACSACGGREGSCDCCRNICCPSGSCEPCWLPRELEPIRTVIGHGNVLRVKFRVDNQSLERRMFLVAATGADAELAKGAPSTAEIDPMSRGELVASIRVPSQGRHGHRPLDLTLWVRGCQDFVTPVHIQPDDDGCSELAVRRVVDRPDTCHTWRDHFYSSRRCGDAAL